MAFKKFGDVEYPIPGINTAMQVLRPGARWSATDSSLDGYEDDEGREPPTFEELEEEIRREFYIFNDYEYERYHDIKNNNLTEGSWIKTIESVKNKYPKPE